MTDRGNSTHGPELDDQLAHEAQSIVQGHGNNAHVEEFRQSEAVPDDTDDAETVAASGYDGAVEGALQDDGSVLDGDGAAGESGDGAGASGDGAGASDDVVFTSESDEDGDR